MNNKMNPLKKLLLYPIAITGIIILITCLNWVLTAFFSVIFSTTIASVALSPMIVIYILSGIGTLYLTVYYCQYIDEEL